MAIFLIISLRYILSYLELQNKRLRNNTLTLPFKVLRNYCQFKKTGRSINCISILSKFVYMKFCYNLSLRNKNLIYFNLNGLILKVSCISDTDLNIISMKLIQYKISTPIQVLISYSQRSPCSSLRAFSTYCTYLISRIKHRAIGTFHCRSNPIVTLIVSITSLSVLVVSIRFTVA